MSLLAPQWQRRPIIQICKHRIEEMSKIIVHKWCIQKVENFAAVLSASSEDLYYLGQEWENKDVLLQILCKSPQCRNIAQILAEDNSWIWHIKHVCCQIFQHQKGKQDISKSSNERLSRAISSARVNFMHCQAIQWLTRILACPRLLPRTFFMVRLSVLFYHYRCVEFSWLRQWYYTSQCIKSGKMKIIGCTLVSLSRWRQPYHVARLHSMLSILIGMISYQCSISCITTVNTALINTVWVQYRLVCTMVSVS